MYLQGAGDLGGVWGLLDTAPVPVWGNDSDNDSDDNNNDN